MILFKYSFSLETFVLRVSCEVSFLRESIEMPIDLAYKGDLMPASLSSLKVNPLPSLIFLLYLLVCPLTAGRREWVGLC